MARFHNFSAGPAALPLPVLEQIQAEFLDFRGEGASVIEISHRGGAFDAVAKSAEDGVRKLLNLSDDYAVLFLQGGASLQFAMAPMNLLNGGVADYIDTGVWSSKAIKEAKFFGKVNVAYSGKDTNYVRIPKQDELKLSADAAYTHFTTNNTIYGTQWTTFPQAKNPLVADMSSDIFSRPFDIKPFGLVYAGAQKNIGPSGMALVIMRKDLAAKVKETVPTMLRYSIHIENDSMFNTPNTFGIYVLDLVCKWLLAQGGLAGMAKVNTAKADALYAAIDASKGFYNCPVEKASRSQMNVVYRLPSEELEKAFLSGAKKNCMAGLKGHRSVGGVRASLYNATSLESVKALVSYMNDFAAKNG